ncbi:MAG: UTP--glucose-1-phosphate uridylyltransferase [Miltoncostaeaceae bacterium]
MSGVSQALADRLRAAGQEHLVAAAEALGPGDREHLVADIEGLDLDRVSELVDRFCGDQREAEEALADIGPPDAVGIPRDADALVRDREARAEGEALLRSGRVGCVLLAGGQGTRLGFEGPKGDYPFAPVTGRTLFWNHCAKIAALRERYGCELPFCVLTSPANDAATRELFAANRNYGLAEGSVRFVVQGTMPAVDAASGRILLEAPDRLALSPDGHGGVLAALRRAGVLDEWTGAGLTTVYTFQVDNPLVRVARPEFLGHHALAGAEMSTVVVRKTSPQEKMGVVADVGGRTAVVEYSDLPDDLARWTDEDGGLVLWAGSIAVHCIELEFIGRVTDAAAGLPFHRALKKVPHVGPDGTRVAPEGPNAIKFETFLFDALPEARATATVEAAREDEFSPIKNAEGADSPATARVHLNELYARWLAAAGVEVPRVDGMPVDLEIDPRFALDADQLAARIPPGLTIDGPTAIGQEDRG